MKRLKDGRVQAPEEIAHCAIAVFVRFRTRRRMGGPADDCQREEYATGPLQYAFHSFLSYARRSDLVRPQTWSAG